MLRKISLIVQSIFYVIAGVNHFIKPELYYKMIPPFLSSFNTSINIISGALEVICGVLLLPKQTRKYAAYGIILILIGVFPANIYMVLSEKVILDVPQWSLWLRLPIQFLLMYWAYVFTKEKETV